METYFVYIHKDISAIVISLGRLLAVVFTPSTQLDT